MSDHLTHPLELISIDKQTSQRLPIKLYSIAHLVAYLLRLTKVRAGNRCAHPLAASCNSLRGRSSSCHESFRLWHCNCTAGGSWRGRRCSSSCCSRDRCRQPGTAAQGPEVAQDLETQGSILLHTIVRLRSCSFWPGSKLDLRAIALIRHSGRCKFVV